MTSAIRSSPATAYADDFYTWTQEQGAHLRAGEVAALDLENLAEEIESLGRNEFNRLVAAVHEILRAILIIDHCPEPYGRAAAIDIAAHRLEVTYLIADSPRLGDRIDAAMARAYQTALLRAADAADLPLSHFPEICPYDGDEVLNRVFAIDPDGGAE